jgi:phage-related tail fiber protein
MLLWTNPSVLVMSTVYAAFTVAQTRHLHFVSQDGLLVVLRVNDMTQAIGGAWLHWQHGDGYNIYICCPSTFPGSFRKDSTEVDPGNVQSGCWTLSIWTGP